jgi:hypothetical protein
MKRIIPNFFKLVAIAGVSAGIFFLVSSDEEMQDVALANSMEFLGKKLLAMTPHEDGDHVQEQFKLLEQEAIEGKVDPRELQSFAVTVLNLEAEGKKLRADKLATLIAEARRSKTAHFDQERMRRLAAQLHQYEQFEQKLKLIAPPAPHPTNSEVQVPHYRISPQFTIQIDTMRLVFAKTPAIPVPPIADTTTVKVFVPPKGILARTKALAELSNELRDLKIEFGRIQMDIDMQDSLKALHDELRQNLGKPGDDTPPQNIP